MKILLLGATGRTGKLVLEKAIESGYEVNCLARNVTRIKKQKGLLLFEGNPNSKIDLEKAIEGCDYVISVLNISRKTDFPWSAIRTPERYLSDVMNHLASVASEKKIKRMVICSAWGVSETKGDLPKWFKWLIDHSNIGIAYQDHERQEKILTELKLDWTIVRPVGLTNSKKEQIVKESFGNKPRPGLTISRQSVAHYLLDSIKNDQLSQAKVVISKE